MYNPSFCVQAQDYKFKPLLSYVFLLELAMNICTNLSSEL